jgi:hypothetical protein
MELWEQLELIRRNILEILEDANLGTNAIIFGDRTRVNDLRPPVLWILPEDSDISQSGIAENWTYRFVLAAVVKDNDPDKGRIKANQIAAKAAVALEKSHNIKNSITNVERVRYLPGDIRGQTAEQLHGAAYEMQAKFRYLEREV